MQCRPRSRNQGPVVSDQDHIMLNRRWCCFLNQPCSLPPMNTAFRLWELPLLFLLWSWWLCKARTFSCSSQTNALMFLVLRDWESFVSPWPRCRDMWWGTPNKELPCQHFAGLEEHPLPPAGGADWLPTPEQPHRVLVHGRLCPAWLSRLEAGIQQHVWAPHPERAVYWQHPSRCPSHEVSQPRPA